MQNFRLISVYALALIGLILSAVSLSHAQATRRTNNTYTTPSYSRHVHAFSGLIGFYSPGAATYTGKPTGGTTDIARSPAVSGLFGIGADYDYMMADDMSFGGLFRYYNTSDTVNQTEFTNSLLSIGGTVKAWLANTTHWAGYLGTGFGIVSPGYKEKTSGGTSQDLEMSMGFGFYLQMGALYKLTEQIGVGFENLRIISVGEKQNGMPLNDYMLKVRFLM